MNLSDKKKHSGRNGDALGPFLAMIGRHWPAMALGTGLAALATVAGIALLTVSGWFIAASALAGLQTATAQIFNFFFPSVGVRLLAIMRTITRYGERIVSHDATFRILETLRGWCYRRLEPLVPARLGRLHSGDLLARIITDIDTLDNLYLRMLSPTVVAVATIGLLSLFIYAFSAPITFVAATALITASVFIPTLGQRLGRNAAQNLNQCSARLRSTLVDGIFNLAALLSSGAEHRYRQKVVQRHADLVSQQLRMSHIAGLTSALMSLTTGLATVATLYIGVHAVVQGHLNTPVLAMLTLAVLAGFDAVIMLPTAYQYLGQTRRAALRLQSLVQVEPAVLFPPDTASHCDNLDIVFRNVSFQYHDAEEPTLSHIDLHIAQGRRLAIIGPTGAGKSTLLYLLARFEDPTGGEILLGQRPLKSYSEQALRNSICIIDQRAHIFNGTIRDNLTIVSPQAEESAFWEALAVVHLKDFVLNLPDGLDTWVGEAGRLLSGGQARRLAVARAVLSDAPIWGFDEPTEGLDNETAKAMIAALLEKGREKTVVMITHRPEALSLMDDIITLENGRFTRNTQRL